MFSHREGHGCSPDSHPPVIPTGLRSRSSTSRMPSHLGQTHSASLNPKTRLGGEIPPSPPNILPLFASPRPSDHKEPKKTWVGSASKRLRFPKLREKASFAKEQTPTASKKDQIPKSTSTRKLIVCRRIGSSHDTNPSTDWAKDSSRNSR
jgi:hypothetical protein